MRGKEPLTPSKRRTIPAPKQETFVARNSAGTMSAVETFVAGDGERGVRKGGTCVASTGCGYG